MEEDSLCLSHYENLRIFFYRENSSNKYKTGADYENHISGFFFFEMGVKIKTMEKVIHDSIDELSRV